ncbi:MAG: carboxypeptidase regulatory-like domain-containing protein, partial [Planctomycetes bacterium]|nr:carboxypeptidase regulatory-like domain-containing protein [Planctomycetota bacterium]
RVCGLPSGRAIVSAREVGYRRAETTIEIADGDPTHVDLSLERGAIVAGRIVDPGGRPIPRARVMSTTGGSFEFAGMDFGSIQNDVLRVKLYASGIEADESGAFEFGGLDDGAVVGVVAVAPGFDLKRIDEVSAGSRDLEIVLEPTASVRGTVVAAEDGRPIESFEVAVEKSAFMMFDQRVAVEEFDGVEDGRFEVEDVPRERAKLVVEARGFAPATKSVDLSQGSVDVGEIRLLVPASVSGITVDPNGNALAGVKIRVAKGGAADSLMMAQMLGSEIIESDADGRFRIEGLAGKRVRLVADKDGYATQRTDPIPLEVGRETKDVRVVLDGGGSLHVHLVDDAGDPLAGWTCFASHTSGRSMRIGKTDRNGEVVLVGLESGPTKVDCMPGDFMTRFAAMGQDPTQGPSMAEITSKIGEAMRMVVSERVVIRSGERLDVEFVFEGDRPESRGGVAVDGSVRVGSAPLESGMFIVTRAGATLPSGMATVTDGSFSLDRLAPGTYRCQVRRGMLGGNVGVERVVEVPDRESHHIDIELPGGSIRGRILDAEGVPVGGAIVSLSSVDATSSFDRMEFGEGTSVTADDGRYAFDGLEDGSYEVFARTLLGGRTRSARSGAITVAGGRVNDFDVTLRDGGTLRVSVRDANGPSRNAIVTVLDGNGEPMSLFQRALTDGDGHVEFGALPAGSYRVVASAPGSAPGISSGVEIVDERVAQIVLEVRSGVPTFVSLDGSKLDELRNEVVLFTVRRDGAVVLAGQGTVGDAIGSGAGRVPIGQLAPGSYQVVLESARLGVVRAEREVRAGAEAIWRID